jgi:hypothetical protein
MNPISQFWSTADGLPDGGQSSGIGFSIAWQRGPLTGGRNGAFLIEVMEACLAQLIYYESTPFDSPENEQAREHLSRSIEILKARRDRRESQGILGEQIPDPKE